MTITAISIYQPMFLFTLLWILRQNKNIPFYNEFGFLSVVLFFFVFFFILLAEKTIRYPFNDSKRQE